MKFSRLSRIHTNCRITKNQTITLSGDIFHYCCSVLRMKPLEEFRLFNQNDGEFKVKIISIGKHDLQIIVQDKLRDVVDTAPLILAMCLIKSDGFIQAIKAATALGATEIIPVISNRTQVKAINKERCIKCITEAVEQSERFLIPTLHDLVTLEQFCQQEIDLFDQLIFANEEESSGANLYYIPGFKEKLAVLIGPEGGFTQEEKIKLISNPKVTSVSLGDMVLRSELAVISCLACVQLLRTFKAC